jgi:hypothetical protein
VQSALAKHAGRSLPLGNEEVAACLEEVADLLEAQGANAFRARAYRSASQTLRHLKESAREILAREGMSGLMDLPGIGRSLARSIEQLVFTGSLGLLQRLRGESDPEHLFLTLPGIGLEMAGRIHEHLAIESLAELEVAAYDGRLARVPGMGAKRLRAIRESLAARFRHRPAMADFPHSQPALDEPPVQELLDIDREYRHKADAGQLPRIAPRRFNPTREAWLPVLHTERETRHYTALFSNTARAHELGMTHDWVVIFRDDHDGHGQWTVITARFGPLRGRRVVRGREAECAENVSSEMQEKHAKQLLFFH